MFRPLPLFIGARYTRARRRSHFVSFISLTSIIGLALGVLVMILVLSVMKDTALVMWIGIVELLRASQTIATRIQEPLLVLCIAGLIYYVMSLVVAQLGARLEKRWQEND